MWKAVIEMMSIFITKSPFLSIHPSDEDKVLKSDMDAMEMMYDMLMDQVRDIRNVFKTAEENTQGSEDSEFLDFYSLHSNNI